jgi:TnpA family transposase
MPVDFLTDEQAARYGRYNEEPNPVQLARYFYLDDADRALIMRCRDDHTRLGMALQICTARFLGTFLTNPTDVPSGVITHLAAQLAIADPTCLAQYGVRKTQWKHAAEIQAAYDYRIFTGQPQHFRFLRWLYARAWIGTERPSVLFDRATAWLVLRKILLPGVTVLERTIAEVRDHANTRMWRLLAQTITPTQQAQLDALLVVPAGERSTLLEQLRRAPTAESGPGLVHGLERFATIQQLHIPRLTATRIPPSRLTNLARFAMTARAQAIARLKPPSRRSATLLAFIHLLEATAHDDVLDIFDAFFTTLFADATQAGIKERLRTLKDLDSAALQLATIGAMVLDPTLADADLRSLVLTIVSPEEIRLALDQVADLAQPPDDTYYDELATRYRRVSRVRPTFLRTIQFDSLPAGKPMLDAYRFLQAIEPNPRASLQKAPRAVINRVWQRYALTAQHTVDRMAYTYCVFDRLKHALRRREVFVAPSVRYADPRLGMLTDTEWDAARPQICRMLGRTTKAADELATLAERLDAVYHSTSAELPDNAAVRIETVNGKAELILSPLDKLDDPPSLRLLRNSVSRQLPQADLPEVLLEIHRRTGFVGDFTHISEAEARADDLDISICAVLLAQACNVGFAPLINPHIPALTRERLSWVQQNYIRAETITRSNTRLVDAQSTNGLAQRWGGGEVASADGLRFIVPVRTINAGRNAKYFPRQRGITFYNLVSNQFTGLNGIVAAGTLRDSLVLLSLVLGQQTNLQPKEIMTDTGAYSDIMFALFWLLGYQFSPRISDVGGTRFWRIDPTADYGALNGLARNRINVTLITDHWDEILRLAGSLATGVFHVESLIRTLQRGDQPTKLARALGEVGRIIKTIYLLEYIGDESYRRRVLTQLNRGEGRHSLSRAVFHGQRGELRQRYREGQEDQLGALGLVVNCIVLWNTIYMDQAVTQLDVEGLCPDDADVVRLSPLGHEHLNFLGRYSFELPEPIRHGEYRPLRTPEERPLDSL